MRSTPRDIDGYIDGFPAKTQKILRGLRAAIKKCAPRASEAICYRMPTFKLGGKNLVHFAAYAHHIGFYPTPSAITEFKKELSAYKNAKGSVQFPIEAPMPLGLIRKMVGFRVKEISKKEMPRTCSRGHRFKGSGPCPVCWPGSARNNRKEAAAMKKHEARQKIIPTLWFDKEAGEAATLYTSLFKGSGITGVTTLRNTPSGTAEIVAARLAGQEFRLFSAGPFFKFTPAVSFLVACETKDEVDALWARLSDKGKVMMPLGAYPFSDRYGWVQDRYGLSWQVMFMGGRGIRQKIVPTLMYTGAQCGRAAEAVRLYASVFEDSAVGDILHYGRDEAPDAETSVKHVSFTLAGRQFAAMDSARVFDAPFNEAVSFTVTCGTQEEIDHYWKKLSADPAVEQCGWLKDKFGVSWQVVPAVLGEMLNDKNAQKADRVTQAFLKMKKFDIKKLEKAYKGR